MRKYLIVLGSCFAVSLLAQGPPPGRGMGRMGPGPMIGFGPGMGRTITGAPYSAQEITEETQTLANGNVISRKVQVNVYRDSSGRVRTERAVPMGRQAPGETAAPNTTRTVVTIHDPVAGVSTNLDAASKTARQVKLPNFGNNPGFEGRQGRGPQSGVSDPNVVTENLGMQTINGVQANGTRITRTIPAETIGNAQPIQIVTETWRSPDLQVPVMTKRVDPRYGTVVTQLTNITRAEPDPALFQVPSDYTVTQGRGPRGPNPMVRQ